MLRRLGNIVRFFTGRQNIFSSNAVKTFAFFAFVFCLLLTPTLVSAQLTSNDIGLEYANEIGLTTTDIRTLIGRIINAFLGLLGIVLVVIFMYAGFLYMTAGGDALKVQKAKQYMINAVIGLVILMSAYAITAFLFQAITNALFGGGPPSQSSEPSRLGELRDGDSHLLGNGIIEYHYPETGQTDVPRNTFISITFKRPLVLSSVIANYDDQGDYSFDGDEVIDTDGVTHSITSFEDLVDLSLALNTDNIKVIPNDSLGEVDDFDTRYPNDQLIDAGTGITKVRVSVVSDSFNMQDKQTMVIVPDEYLGSSTTDMDYRVAFRSGDTGLQVWSPDEGYEEGNDPVIENAFESTSANGGYYWPFTTGTALDLTPPSISKIFPSTSSGAIERNVLLQAYFSEAMDATTTSGRIGGGFSNIEIEGRCQAGADCPCWIPGADCSDFQPIPGVIKLGPRYRTAEFIPDLPCETVQVNSCGDPVYCLPKNIDLNVRVHAATLSDDPPKAELPDGPLDMVGNSLDGNDNGVADGPSSSDYFRNTGDGAGDTTYWLYQVGDVIDLTVPQIYQTDPPSESVAVTIDTPHPEGPSMVPPELPVSITWSKVMSVTSAFSGAFNEAGGNEIFTDPRSTVALRSRELEKANPERDCLSLLPADCPTLDPLPPPYFFVGFEPILHPNGSGSEVSLMTISHRDFLTPNDLGFTELEVTSGHTQGIPLYQPVLGNKLKDAWQNCFYPSERVGCENMDTAGINSCCNSQGMGDFSCPIGL